MNNDVVYLNRRACEERAAALGCRHLGVRDIHLELALAYEFRVLLLSKPDFSVDDDLPDRQTDEESALGRSASGESPIRTLII